MKAMSTPELVIYLLTLVFWIVCYVGGLVLSILGFFLTLMRGSLGQEDQAAKEMEMMRSKKKSKDFIQFYPDLMTPLIIRGSC